MFRLNDAPICRGNAVLVLVYLTAVSKSLAIIPDRSKNMSNCVAFASSFTLLKTSRVLLKQLAKFNFPKIFSKRHK